jgi:gliding motility-associated-like protein
MFKKIKYSILIGLIVIIALPFCWFIAQNGKPVYNENLDIYRIVAVRNQNDQIVSVSNTISVEKPLAIYAPNAFSPDGDGVNDEFNIVGQGAIDYKLEIFNRWGQMVFKAQDMNTAWSGDFQGSPAPMGTYVYKVKTKGFSGGEKMLKTGTVVLIR